MTYGESVGLVTLSMTSDDLERSMSWLQYVWALLSRKCQLLKTSTI